MTNNSERSAPPTPETDLAALRSMAGWPALSPSLRATCRAAIAELEGLRAVAVAARALVQTAETTTSPDTEAVNEAALTVLESALAAAGYDMTDEEFVKGLEDREPPEPDGECFRGGEAAAYLAEQQDAARRLK